jgi:hypothetical protein
MTGVVYVGSTCKLVRRVAEHKREGKQFDTHLALSCSEEHAQALETIFIHWLNPKLNGLIRGGKNNGKYSHCRLPMSIERASKILGLR